LVEPEGGGAGQAPRFERAEPDGRLYAPTFARNGQPIRDALLPQLDVEGAILEIGCGSGEHAAAIAAACPGRRVLATDIDEAHRRSAAAHAQAAGLGNAAPPRSLDAAADWAAGVADLSPLALVLAINIVHIADWSVSEGLFAGAGRVLAPGGLLALYGPFVEPDRPLADSNVAFDAGLRARNPAWGIRALDDLERLAGAAGLVSRRVDRLPANNLLVTWRRG
jgi:SAM-dependent methyltransferase